MHTYSIADCAAAPSFNARLGEGVDGRQKVGLALAIAAAAFDVPPDGIRAAGRRAAPIADARHVAIYLAHIVFQLPMQVVADAFARDRTSVGHAVRRVEDRRDDAAFDQLMDRLERLAMFCATSDAVAARSGRR